MYFTPLPMQKYRLWGAEKTRMVYSLGHPHMFDDA